MCLPQHRTFVRRRSSRASANTDFSGRCPEPYFQSKAKQKTPVGRFFIGDRGARTLDLTDVNRALWPTELCLRTRILYNGGGAMSRARFDLFSRLHSHKRDISRALKRQPAKVAFGKHPVFIAVNFKFEPVAAFDFKRRKIARRRRRKIAVSAGYIACGRVCVMRDIGPSRYDARLDGETRGIVVLVPSQNSGHDHIREYPDHGYEYGGEHYVKHIEIHRERMNR